MGSNNYIRESIFKTLAYADIFDYPLTQEEIWKFLLSDSSISKELFARELLQSRFIFQEKGFFCLLGKEACITKRIRAKVQSQRKYTIITDIIGVLSHIPTVLLIGVTGSLAMDNVTENDDIDICILAKKHTIWITRLVTLVMLQLLGKRRKRNQQNVSDVVCVNLFIDEDGMTVVKEKQNVYTAHEVVQMQPVFDRNRMHERFLAANMWVREFLPNALTGIMNYELGIRKKQKNPLFIIRYSLFIVEWLAKKVQLWYMRRRGIAGVSNHVLAFFPADYAERILDIYRKKVAKYAKYAHI